MYMIPPRRVGKGGPEPKGGEGDPALSSEMCACNNSKPQGLEEHFRHDTSDNLPTSRRRFRAVLACPQNEYIYIYIYTDR